MCGIAGYDFSGEIEPGALLAESMRRALQHRGPDGDGARFFERQDRRVREVQAPGRIALIHTRLAIIDLSDAGSEPLPNESGRIWLTFNGEIYNFRALRAELEVLGHRFSSHTDAEVIVHGYESWGDLVVERLRGMFAFAIYDADRDRWLCARDRHGIKPFVYTATDGLFAFSSELGPLQHLPGSSDQIDPEGLAQYLALGYVPAPWTIRRAVRKLPRGHALRVERGAVEVWPFAAGDAPAEVCDLEVAVEEVQAALQDSVRAHLVADVPIACFLSGGVDSSLVCAIAAKLGADLDCFTMGFDDARFDERPFASRVAEALGVRWHAETATAELTRQVLTRLPAIFDEPFADSSAAPMALLAAMTRRHVKAVLSGDGGDELFLGYTRYQLFSLADQCQRLPRRARRAAARVAAHVPGPVIDQLYDRLRGLGRLPRLSHPARKLQAVSLALASDDRVALYADTLRVAGPGVLERLLAGAEATALAALRDASRQAPATPPALYASVIDEGTYLPEDILTKVDRTTMAVGLEARVPIVDARVSRVARAIAPRLHTRRGGKAVLKRVLDRHLSPALTRRPKQGFSIPLAQWLRGPLAPQVTALETDPRFADLHLSRSGIAGLAREHLDGVWDHGPALWALICLKGFLDKERAP